MATDNRQQKAATEAAVVFWTIGDDEARIGVDPVGALLRFFALVRWVLGAPAVRLSLGAGKLHHE